MSYHGFLPIVGDVDMMGEKGDFVSTFVFQGHMI